MPDRDEGFAAWLAMNDALLELEFLDGDVPDLPDNPFTEDGLRVAEANALARWSSATEVLAPEHRHTYDKFVRFVGEAYVRGLGAAWTNKPVHDTGQAYIGVRFPGEDDSLEIPTMITSAVERRTGDEWAFVWRMAKEDLDARS